MEGDIFLAGYADIIVYKAGNFVLKKESEGQNHEKTNPGPGIDDWGL